MVVVSLDTVFTQCLRSVVPCGHIAFTTKIGKLRCGFPFETQKLMLLLFQATKNLYFSNVCNNKVVYCVPMLKGGTGNTCSQRLGCL